MANLPANLLEFGEAGFGVQPYSTSWPNNTTGVVIKANPGLIFEVHADNNTTNAAYLKVYDTASVPDQTVTPVLRFQVPPQASGPLDVSLRGGYAMANGIAIRLTGGIADNDTSSPAASVYLVNLGYK